jgi:hypothetical protein
MGLNELSGVLWRERHLLELLLFKLEVKQLVLSGGRTRWLGHASREIESVLDQIRGVDLGRAVEAEEAALSLGLDPCSGLLAVAQHAPSPWDELLRQHHEAFVRLTDQIRGLAETNREMLATSHRAVQETLRSLQDTVQTSDARG